MIGSVFFERILKAICLCQRGISLVFLLMLFVSVSHFVVPQAFAAEPSMVVRLDRAQVVTGEAFRLTVEVRDAGGSQVEPSLPSGFEIVGQSSQTSFSFGTGRGSERVNRIVFSIIGVQAGKYQLGPFSVKANGKKVVSNSVNVEVLDAAAAAAAKKGSGSGVTSGGSGGASGNGLVNGKQAKKAESRAGRDVFLTTEIAKKEVWVDEPFVVTIKFYFRVPVSNSRLLEADFSQFVSFDDKDVPQAERREVVDGEEYQVVEVRKTYSARSAGQFQIPSIRLETQVSSQRKRRDAASSDDPFERMQEMFDDPFMARVEPKIVAAPPISFAVRPLPEPKPAGWTGVVGDVKILTEISKTELAVGENATLTLRAEGMADLSTMTVPGLGVADGIKTYADKPVLDTSRDGQGVFRQRKVFSVGIVPTQEGHLLIKERGVFVFNPASGAFEERKIPEFALNVRGGAGGDAGTSGSVGAASQSLASPSIQHSVRETGSDIHPPKEDWLAVSRDERVSLLTVLGWVSIPLFLIFVWLILLVRDVLLARGRSENVQFASRRAYGIWKKSISAVRESALSVGSEKSQHVEDLLVKAIRAYVGSRFNCVALAMTSDEVKNVLIEHKCSETLATDCAQILARIDMGKYAGSSNQMSLLDLVSASEKIVSAIEKEGKR